MLLKNELENKVTLTSYVNNDPERIKNIINENDNNERYVDSGDSRRSSSTTLDLPDSIYFRHKSILFSEDEDVPSKKWFKKRIKNLCNTKTLKKRVPIFDYLPRYNWETAISDFLAGLTVGLTIIPQAIAYSSVAGLPAQIGLYSSIVAPLVYAIFGSSKDSPVGPTAIEGLLVRENKHELGVPGAILLCFLSGCVELLMGILHLGFLIDFISGPVAIAFTSAAAIIVATTQIKDLLGLDYPGDKFILVWGQIFEHVSETSCADCTMGFVCIAALMILKKLKDIKVARKDGSRSNCQKVLYGIFWLLSTSRNLLVVVISASVAYCFENQGRSPFRLTGFVKPGLPNITMPPFNTEVNGKNYSFLDMASTLGSGIIILPVLSILQNYAIAKVYSEGKSIDSTQEMLALGICNIASSFVSSMPVSGALSRGAVNHASGVKTTFGGVYTALIVILSLKFLTPWFYYIPKAALAAVIIVAVAFMIELHVFGPIWRTKKTDLIPAIATFIACLFTRLEIGIGLGVAINLAFLLYATARPTIDIEKITSPSGCEYLLITPDRSLSFPSVEYVRSIITKAGTKRGLTSIPIVIDARHIQGADYTAAKGMKLLMRDFSNRNQQIIFIHLKKSVVDTFKGVNPKSFTYCQTFNDLNEILRKCCTKSHCDVNLMPKPYTKL
ncbi:sodium-independent sulfate anion transporter-like [Sitophilus oryzae]|uniref:Sodium-independent sulfate anion transporter-like n=1 Tax=Sitophilus oryzae TaxID=7048 RepID=A0A6J2YJC9_SITOR|nr:sodium-independent sulfate anion transporter-like [Sitophilus oryzae]